MQQKISFRSEEVKTFSMKENYKNLSVANLHLMCMAKGSLLNRKEILTEGT